MTAELHDDLALVVLEDVEVSVSGLRAPERKSLVPSPGIHVAYRDELALGVHRELRLDPCELLFTLGRGLDFCAPLGVVEQSVDREHGNLIRQVDPVKASIEESLFDSG